MNKIKHILIVVGALIPVVSYAQLSGTETLITRVGAIVDQLIVLVAAIALLVFFWGLMRFISKAGGEKAHEEGKRLMIWGTVALFVMVSIWGLVRLLQTELIPAHNVDAPNVRMITPRR